jgi:2-hydroxy-6-oxonona-2,4-dienedioate hydrolase
MHIEECFADVAGSRIRYLTAGMGPALLLLHAAGEDADDWQWVMPTLARTHRVYAPDLPSRDDTSSSYADHSPDSLARFAAEFLAELGVERAAVIGNSLGGLAALSLALSAPSRVTALGLMNSAGLGRAVHPAIAALTAPGYGDLAAAWGRTPVGALQRAWLRASLLFAHPGRVPMAWYTQQYRLAQQPNFLRATLAALRAQVDLGGQRTVLLDQLPGLEMPTLIVWGEQDVIFPVAQARDAIGRLKEGCLELIPECGHLPQVEHPAWCAALLRHFLVGRAGPLRQAVGRER